VRSDVPKIQSSTPRRMEELLRQRTVESKVLRPVDRSGVLRPRRETAGRPKQVDEEESRSDEQRVAQAQQALCMLLIKVQAAEIAAFPRCFATAKAAPTFRAGSSAQSIVRAKRAKLCAVN